MNTDDIYKSRIGQRLTWLLLDAYEQEQLPEEQISYLAGVIREEMHLAKTSAEVFEFVEALAQEWPIFASVLGQVPSTPIKTVHRRWLEQIVR